MLALMSRLFPAALLGASLAGVVVLGCGSSSSSGDAPDATAPDAARAGQPDGGRLSAPIHPAGACPITVETPDLVPGTHVPEGTAITWSSNPPSSGAHYPTWANFQDFAQPVDRGYLVHDLEHGAVVLSYKCEGAACAPLLDGLHKVRDAIPTDARCDASIRVRVTIVPDPLLDVPVAAAAWGWTYKADCLDLPSLTDFARSHYAQGTEDVCAAGRTTF